ncbi:class 1 isoprenoid biosynthesis enzyme [Gaoshiqia sp. Z1-71]|uniref:class 1 isoprenoid biosynthesis enzyme n=1 Tax=Gaoshiqia hydrogeniformans TaxID=3290090 RepID=UPI003BF7DA14
MDYPAEFKNMWNQSATGFPNNLSSFSKNEQSLREIEFDRFLNKLQETSRWSENNSTSATKKELLDLLRSFFRNTLGYSDENLGVILSDEMVRSTFWFINAALVYDPAISFHDIFQACRNVWIMNGLQFLCGKTVCLTPPVFAYSMLYPYTDNYLDDPAISPFEKLDFSNRFAKRLAGNKVDARNIQEEKIFHMVEIIENDWSREQYPGVYRSLLAIHDAQTQSLALMNHAPSLNSDDIFKICVQKGGTSVIADGYLVLGRLTDIEEEFFYHYGAYLQLLDDLQDVADDLNGSLMTCFSSKARQEKLDTWLCKTYNLGLRVMTCTDRLRSVHGDLFKSLMKNSIELFLVESVVTNSPFFSRKFVQKFESHSPLRFSFIKKKNGTFSPYQDQLFVQMMKQASLCREEFSYDFLTKNSLLKEQQAV